MKIGIAISSVIVLAVIGLFVLRLQTPADKPTAASSDQSLKITSLPNGLPVIFEPATGTAEDGNAALAFAFETVREHKEVLRQGGIRPVMKNAAALAVCTALLDAVNAGPFSDGFIDRKIPEGQIDSSPLRIELNALADGYNRRMNLLIDEGEFEEADTLARAWFEFGRRIMAQNIQFKIRQLSLGIMQSGVGNVGRVASAMEDEGVIDADAKKLVTDDTLAWFTAIKVVQDAWSEKLKSIASTKPNVADLVRVAELDEDRSLRVFATYHLGYAKYERGEPGNQRLINKAIATAMESDDTMIRQMGTAASEMTVEQFHDSQH